MNRHLRALPWPVDREITEAGNVYSIKMVVGIADKLARFFGGGVRRNGIVHRVVFGKGNFRVVPVDRRGRGKDQPAYSMFFACFQKVKYRELRAHANQFANALRGIGFRKGDRLGILLANMPQTIVSTFGALKAGGVPVFFDPLAQEEELQRQLNDAEVETLVALDLVLRRVDPIFTKTKLKQFVITGVKDYLPFPRDFLFNLAAKGRGIQVKLARKPNIHLFKEFLLRGQSDSSTADKAPGSPEEVAFILYTSGTSGLPKGVLLTHKNLVANIMQASAWIGELEKGKEIFLSIPPFHQAYGMTMGMNLPIFSAAMSIHLPQFEIIQVLSTFKKHRPSFSRKSKEVKEIKPETRNPQLIFSSVFP